MNFKHVVQKWCADQEIRQGQLAHRLDITPQTLSDILSRGNPTLSTLHRFARVMDVSMTLFEATPVENPRMLCTAEAPCCEDPQVLNLRGCIHCLCRCPCHGHEAAIMRELAGTEAYLDHERPAQEPA